MSDSRRPYRVYPNGETQLFDIWTRADETPGSRNNYVICGNFQDPIEADEFCAAVNNIQEITKQRDQLLEACKALVPLVGAGIPKLLEHSHPEEASGHHDGLLAVIEQAQAAITLAERGAK